MATDAELINAVYSSFGREPTAEEVDYWANTGLSGQTLLNTMGAGMSAEDSAAYDPAVLGSALESFNTTPTPTPTPTQGQDAYWADSGPTGWQEGDPYDYIDSWGNTYSGGRIVKGPAMGGPTTDGGNAITGIDDFRNFQNQVGQTGHFSTAMDGSNVNDFLDFQSNLGGNLGEVSSGPTAEQIAIYNNLTQEQRDSRQWEQFTNLSPEQKVDLGNATPEQLENLAWRGNEAEQDRMEKYYNLTQEQLDSPQWEQFRELSLADKERLGNATNDQLNWLEWQHNVNNGTNNQNYEPTGPGSPGYTPTPEQLDIYEIVKDDPRWEKFRKLSPKDKERIGGATDEQLDWLEWQGKVNTGWQFNPGQGVTGVDQGYGTGAPQLPGNQPGYLSPWGGNADFYRNQFQGLLDDDNEFQRQQAVAEQIRADAAKNPLANQWDWGDTSLAQIQGAPVAGTRQITNEFAGLNNAQVLSSIGDQFGAEQGQFYQDLLAGDTGYGDQTNLASGGYNANFNNTANSNLKPINKGYMNDLYNQIYATTPSGVAQTPGGMTVPQGYASPTNA